MNQVKTLPMHEPLITAYATHANTLSCVLEYPDSWQWFYEHYIQLFGGKDLSTFCYIDFYAPIPWKSCPWIDYQKMSRELIGLQWDSIVEFIMDAVDLGYYPFLYLDTFFIPASINYQKRHNSHETFFFGYNRPEKTFQVADFYGEYLKYSHASLDFGQAQNAYQNLHDINQERDFIDGILLLKPRQPGRYDFNQSALVSLLIEYLASKTTRGYTDGYRKDVEQNKDRWVFGLEVYSLLQEYLELCLRDKNKGIDIRGCHAIYEHKKLMLARIAYLGKEKLLNNPDIILGRYEEVEQLTLMLRNMIVKCSILVRDEKMMRRSIDLIGQIRAKDQNALELLLNHMT